MFFTGSPGRARTARTTGKFLPRERDREREREREIERERDRERDRER